MSDETTIFVDLFRAPSDFSAQLLALGIKWTGWEAQPLADQIKLTGCSHIPETLPSWCERLSDRRNRWRAKG